MINKDFTYNAIYDKINGKNLFTEKAFKNPPICDVGVLQDFVQLVETSTIYKQVFISTYSADYMLSAFPTLPKYLGVNKTEFIEAFYGYKLDCSFYKEVSARLQYFTKLSSQRVHDIPNLVFKVMPISILTDLFTEGFLPIGMTPRDYMCEIFGSEYKPVCKTDPINRMGDFTELYIDDTDMIAAVDNDIAANLNVNTILAIKVDADGLNVDGTYLRTMGNHIGHTMSIYDLRNVI